MKKIISITLSILLLFSLPLMAAQKAEKIRVIHVLVALCDNVHQGIQKVPAHLGNGDDLKGNLYWGAAYGVKTYFKRSQDWQLVAEIRDPEPGILERVVFKKSGKNAYLIADAYRGREIEKATVDTLRYAAGHAGKFIEIPTSKTRLPIGGHAGLVMYVGHDGLMDFQLDKYPQKADSESRDIALLACASKNYFGDAVRASGANPLVWTTNLMAPEAYLVKSIADGWIKGENPQAVREKTAQSYARFQKISQKSAMRLFATGW